MKWRKSALPWSWGAVGAFYSASQQGAFYSASQQGGFLMDKLDNIFLIGFINILLQAKIRESSLCEHLLQPFALNSSIPSTTTKNDVFIEGDDLLRSNVFFLYLLDIAPNYRF